MAQPIHPLLNYWTIAQPGSALSCAQALVAYSSENLAEISRKCSPSLCGTLFWVGLGTGQEPSSSKITRADIIIGKMPLADNRKKMEVFSKELKDTDVRVRLSFRTNCLEHLDFAGSNSVDLRVKDSWGELRVIRCPKRRNRDYEKPVRSKGWLKFICCWKREGNYVKLVLSSGWLKFVADYGLRVGDKVVLLREDDHNLGSQFRIEAQRRIVLHGREDWGEVIRVTC